MNAPAPKSGKTPVTLPSSMTMPPVEVIDYESLEKRLARLERFAERHDAVLWQSLAPHVFGVDDRVLSKMPRHEGVVFLIEQAQVVGDGLLFRCKHPNGDTHLFREREILLAPSESAPGEKETTTP